MLFKKSKKLTFREGVQKYFWPKRGWLRVFKYLHLRFHRLPDKPYRIARGAAVGVFVVFTPFYGLHFVLAFLFAKIIRGNVLAALLATFVGNPLTYVPIGVVALKVGSFLLGVEVHASDLRRFARDFISTFTELLYNFFSFFTSKSADWSALTRFLDDFFLPYLIGGIVVGLPAAIATFYLTLPMIAAFQIARKKKIKEIFRKRSRKRLESQKLNK